MKKPWRLWVHALCWAVVCGFMTGAVGWTAEADALSGRATMKRDGVPLYAQMATTSKVLSALARDAIVQVDFALLNAHGHWCRVTEVASPRRAGYVRCDDLEPGPPASGQPNVVRQEKQQGVPGPAVETVAREARRHLSREDAQQLEDGLMRNPEDLDARARLLGYYFARSLRLSGAAVTLEARRRHILWLIQNRPEAELAGTPAATIDPAGHSLADPEGYRQAKALWLKQVEGYKTSTKVMRSAAKFFQLPDKELAESALKRAQVLEPKNPEWSASLGYLYALGIMGVNGLNQNGLPTSVDPAETTGAFAKKAREELRRSSDAALILAAGSTLSQYGSMIYSTGLSKQDYRGLAEELLKRSGGSGSNAWSLGQHYNLERLRAQSTEAKTEFAKKELAQWEQAIPGAPDEEWRSAILGDAAKAAVEAGEPKKAEKFATELLEIASRHTGEEKYGPAVHDGNMILGRLALRQGNIQEAKAYLIKAGHTLGGGTLTSFGPSMSLAKELLERGERESVIEYLELCKKFWGYKKDLLERWIQTIKSGGTPQFGGNLIY